MEEVVGLSPTSSTRLLTNVVTRVTTCRFNSGVASRVRHMLHQVYSPMRVFYFINGGFVKRSGNNERSEVPSH